MFKVISHTAFFALFAATLTLPAHAQKAPEFPPAEEEVSLDKFDSTYQNLVGDIQKRLTQLSVTEETGEAPALKDEELGGPDLESYGSDLEELSKSQREIKLLEAKLKQAELAKKLWETLHSENVEDLKAKLREIEQEHEAEVRGFKNEIDRLNTDNANLNQQVITLTRQASDAENKAKRAESDLKRARQDMASMQQELDVLREESRQNRMSSVSSGPSVDFPEVVNIRSISGRMEAEIAFFDGERVTVEEGETVNGFEFVEISRTRVIAKTGDMETRLRNYQNRGGDSSSARQQAQSLQQMQNRLRELETQGSAPAVAPTYDYLDQAATNANQ